MGHIQTIGELIAFLLRRWFMIAVIAMAGIAFSLFMASKMPSTYESAAVIQVEGPSVERSGDAGRGAAGQSTTEMLQSIEQRLTTRENMMAVIQRHALYADAPGLTIDQKIALLRRSITFQGVASGLNQVYGGNQQVSAMVISASSGDPEQAARIANDFAQSLLDESNASQTARTRETLVFYNEESRRIETELTALEAEVASYRAAHASSLPAARESRLDESSGLETDLRAVERDLAGLMGQKTLVERTGLTRITDQRQLETLNTQITVAEAQRDALLARKAELQTSEADAAEVDRVLAGFGRRGAQLQAQYEVVSRRVAEAETSSRLADSQQSERISLLERAIAPQQPSSGSGRKIAAAGVLGSVLMAVFAAFALELLRPVVRTAEQMERELALRPVISIPEIRGRRRRA